METKPLTIFVAMPYTSMGQGARLNPDTAIRFYQRTIEMIGQARGCTVKFDFEKWRAEAGSVHSSMFNAIYNADILIADITGGNANVFFELGVRYSLRRCVTIITTQDEKIPFDLQGLRYVQYGHRQLDEDAQKQIVDFACSGLDNGHVDSPIIAALDLHVLKRTDWERVAGLRIETLLKKAADEATPSPQRLKLIEQAVADDPLSLPAHLALAQLCRERQDYTHGLEVTEEALRYFPKSWQILQERGKIHDKMEGPESLLQAIEVYRRALEMECQNPDLHSCLGGSLRRLGLRAKDSKRDELLDESLKHYSEAIRLHRYDTYAGMNTVRLLLLMGQRMDTSTVASHVQRMFHLCAFEVTDEGLRQSDKRWWKLFDFGDTHLFNQNLPSALAAYQEAIDLVPTHKRRDTLKSPLRTWNELVEAEVMGSDMRDGAEQIIALLSDAANAAPSK